MNLPGPIKAKLCENLGVSRKGDVDEILASKVLLPVCKQPYLILVCDFLLHVSFHGVDVCLSH